MRRRIHVHDPRASLGGVGFHTPLVSDVPVFGRCDVNKCLTKVQKRCRFYHEPALYASQTPDFPGWRSASKGVGLIQLSDSTLDSLLDASPDAMLAIDDAGLIVLVNAQTERLFGYRREELIGRPVELLVHIADTKFRPSATGLQMPGRRQDGSEFSASISVSTIATDVGPLISATIRDATERIEVEAELVRVKTEAERVRLEAEADRVKAEGEKTVAEGVRLEAVADRERLEAQLHQSQRMESLGQLAGGVAHDFNNLLAVILNYASFVAEELSGAAATPTGAQWKGPLKDVEQIQLAAERASLLTHQLLSFARREVVQARALSLNSAITRMEQILRRTIGEQIELVISLADSLPMILADPGQIEQIVLNLAINARDAMPTGGILTIDTSVREITANGDFTSDPPAGSYVCFRVGDTGVGMSEEVRDHAFEPFFTTKPRGEGSGLGLATVYGIVSQSGGYTRIYSDEGVGTSLTILLPAATQDAILDAPDGGVDHLKPRSVTETILVVDDEEALREVTRRILTRNGYTVVTASSGAEAIDIAASGVGPIDLLITDVIMPAMQGPTVANEVRKLRPGIRVLFMSGHAQPVLEAEAVLGTEFLLLEKPFDQAMLLENVRKVLDRDE